MPGETALVFDDDNFFRTLWSDTLTDLNLQVITFPTHELFLSQIKDDCSSVSLPCPDFILTDNQMPGMTGLEFLARISQLGCKIRGDRIGIISGRWEEDEIEKAMQMGWRVFQKYNSPEQIRAWIEETRNSPEAPGGDLRG
jgi:CheY-like chemotaxis protein